MSTTLDALRAKRDQLTTLIDLWETLSNEDSTPEVTRQKRKPDIRVAQRKRWSPAARKAASLRMKRIWKAKG